VTFKWLFKVKPMLLSYGPLETIQLLSETFFHNFHIFRDISGAIKIKHPVYSGSPRGTKAMWQMWEKNVIIAVDYTPCLFDLELTLVASVVGQHCCSRPRRIYIHRLSVSRISSMQMCTIPIVMSSITFKFIGSRR